MPEESSSHNVNPRLVADIVSSYVGKNSVAIDQIGGLIASVHQTLTGLGTNTAVPTLAAEKLTPAVPLRRSVQPNHVVCLECGFRGKTLRRHLRVSHGLEAVQYRARWKLSSDHPLTAPEYASRRSAMAKQFGLGRTPAEAAAPAPRGRRRAAAQ